MNSDNGADFWNLVDGIIVINIDERTDRWETLLTHVGQHFDTSKIHRLSATRGTMIPGYSTPPLFRGRQRDKTWAARGGCTLSHRDAIEYAKKAGWRTVLILEDDIELSPDFDRQLPALARALKNRHWDICYLGYTDPVSPFRPVASLEGEFTLQRIFGCSATHAYLLADHVYDWLLAELPAPDRLWIWLTRHRAIDRWYKHTLSTHFDVMAVSPSIINQRTGYSDVVHRETGNEKPYRVKVPDNAYSSYVYNLAYLVRRIIFAIAGVRDYFRGLYKRVNGF
jgi:GR25 family glycosyltransferase involved in LPS biosynthesis